MNEGKQPPERELSAILGAGLFTNSLWDMLSVVVPLYAVAVGLDASEIGLIVAARSVLPAALSVHGGIVIDQIGTRKMLMAVAAASVLLPLLYPLSGWFAVLVLLQLLLGFASTLAMAASQTWAMQAGRGDTATLARYAIATFTGTFIGPVVAGAAWDHFGAWAAFSCMALCGAGSIAAAGRSTTAPPPGPQGHGMSVLVPRWRPHKEALQLALIPAVAFILAAFFLRNCTGAIQNSLFVVYLNETGFSGTLIGALVSISELSGVGGSLLAARAERHVGRMRLIVLCIVVSVVCICATPLTAAFPAALIGACVLRGTMQGMSHPLMYSLLSHEVAGNRHGASVGLRNAVVRLGGIIVPAVMGVAAEAYGVAASFYVVGAALLLATTGLAIAARNIR